MVNLTDPAYVEAENERILTMLTAMYVKSMYPDLTIVEIFEKLQDVEFIKEVINRVIGDIYKALGESEHEHIIVRRFCPCCLRITKWRVAPKPKDKYWEVHTCTECKNYEEYKTQ